MRAAELKTVGWACLAVVPATLISVCCLDTWLALRAMELLRISALFQTAASNIPDVLSVVVFLVSCLLWGRYVIFKRRRITNDEVLFCQIAGTALPCAFLLKWPLKVIFGRTNTRVWLASRLGDDFHWFHGGGDYSSFPSGHMMVFAAFFTALWLFYPRYRLLSVLFMLGLASALVVTDHHFLSDVIMGGYIGFSTTVLIGVFWHKRSRLEL